MEQSDVQRSGATQRSSNERNGAEQHGTMRNGVHNQDWAAVTMGVARAYANMCEVVSMRHLGCGACTLKPCRNDHGCVHPV